jgi:TPR repeat protein
MDEPLFPGTDMNVYRSYRDRVFRDTKIDLADRPLFGQQSALTEEDIAEFRSMKSRADSGDADAMLRLGGFYELGHGTLQNFEEAVRYFHLSASKGNPIGMFNYATYLASGQGVPQDLVESARWLREAADVYKMRQASICLAMQLARGYGVDQDIPEAIKMLTIYANPPYNDPEAQYHLGSLFDEIGKPAEAKRYLLLSHGQGQDAAGCDLATMHLNGRGSAIPVDFNFGIRMLEQTAGRGHPMSNFNLGVIHMEGRYGKAVNLARAKECLLFAGENGVSDGYVKLGVILLKREGNPTKAVEYFRKAVDMGDTAAFFIYGRLLMNGDGVPRDYREARRYLMEAAQQDIPQAMIALAEIEGDGLAGDPPDTKFARDLLLRAEGLGSAEATRRLAAMPK